MADALQWVAASNGEVPPDALLVGTEGDGNLYVGRAKHEGDVIPGKIHTGHKVCYVAWGGAEHAIPEYEALVVPSGVTVEWVAQSGGAVPDNAVPGGEQEDGQKLFIGRADHEGSITPGKVHPVHGVLYVAYGGEEHPHQEYEVLVASS